MSAPVVAIIGRPNVGKSTLFNRIIGERRAVVHDRPGITRDRNAVRAEWTGRAFVLVDTGGFLPTASEGRDADVRRQAEAAIGLAHAVIFLVDAQTGVTDLDQAIATQLRRTHSRALLVVNKVDVPGDAIVHDFHRLGLGEPLAVAAEGGLGIGDLLDAVLALLPPEREREEKPDARVAIVGRPNVGKSSIVNALLGEERVLVESTAGHDHGRDRHRLGDAARALHARGHGRDPPPVDVRRPGRVLRDDARAERRSSAPTWRASWWTRWQGFEKQEARLAHHALDAGCSLLLLYNKWDLVEDREQAWKDVTADRGRRFPTLADLPAHPISATENIHLARLPEYIAQRAAENNRRIPTAQLNEWLALAQKRRQVPSNAAGRSPKIYYMTQTGSGPPTFTLFVNAPSRLNENYRRYLWGQFVEHFGFRGTPLRFKVKKSE